MKKLLLVPVSFLPYIFSVALLFSESFSGTEQKILLLSFIGYVVLTFLCNLVFVILSAHEDASKLLRAAIWIKLVHIPAYICVFFIGTIMSLMIFMTLPFIIFLVFFDYTILLFSSFISVFVLIKNIKNNAVLSVIAIICQFFFCADIISLIVLRYIEKKRLL